MSAVIKVRAYRNDDGFVWLCGFPDETSSEPLEAAFYESEDWLKDLEAEAMPLLEDYSAVVVDDTADLWSRWPAEPCAIGVTRGP